MELQIKPFTIPEVIINNFEELEAEITKKSSDYSTLVYTDEQIGEAKKDRASLNKFVKALDDERKKIKKECLKPYEEVEPKFKKLEGIVNQAIKNSDSQVKGYEEKKKADKMDEIKELWNNGVDFQDKPEWLEFEQIFNPKWLNSSVSMKSVDEEMYSKLSQIEGDINTLANLPEFSFEATEVYKSSLDLGKAIQEGQKLAEMAKRKAEAEIAKHMNPPETDQKDQLEGQIGFKDAESFERCIPKTESVSEYVERKCDPEPVAAEEREWIGFKAHLTVADAQALANLFSVRGIEFERIVI